MPSTRTRLALTLPDELRHALFELGEVMGKPAATVAMELLMEMVPQIEGLTKIHRATKAGNKQAAKQALQHMVGDTMAEMLMQEQKDLFKQRKAKK